MADLKKLVESLRGIIDEIDAALMENETEDMPEEEESEDMGMRTGMRPKKAATMTDYFSTKKM